MLFSPTKTSASVIESAVSLFTTAQTELSEGIALGKAEAAEIETKIIEAQNDLADVNEKVSYGEAIYKNISTLLNTGN